MEIDSVCSFALPAWTHQFSAWYATFVEFDLFPEISSATARTNEKVNKRRRFISLVVQLQEEELCEESIQDASGFNDVFFSSD